ncbi:3-deoxy-7-phosphoheptulonate synthase [Amycolatopsis sp. NBC_00355]|uniref:3-deoxy-7-phosphoheptulonate synthase n=1 Tax=Amycolatopsis sp. NBC_00355 TaxID=2975957 RepID=UPI002E266C73
MTGVITHGTAQWQPDSWRSAPTGMQPVWPDEHELPAIIDELHAAPDLVTAGEIDALARGIAQAAAGDALVIHAGECAERFSAVSAADVAARVAQLRELGDELTGKRSPAVVIGRIAGQYAKPRSTTTRLLVRGFSVTEIASYRGDIVNDVAPDRLSRTPDPRRLLRAYHHAAATMSLLRADAVGRAGSRTSVFTSHEALLLQYEEALTRERGGSWLNTGTHLPWVGYRTADPAGGHVRYLSGIGNPVAVKVSAGTSPSTLAEVCARLDPDRRPGRLLLIGRFGADRVAEVLPALADVVRNAGHVPAWVCDPMHGNTFTGPQGRKTRRVADLLREITGFVGALTKMGVPAAGLHLEVTTEPVTECVGGPGGPDAAGLARRYTTTCDPRLNPRQAKFVVAETRRLLLR